MHDPTPRGYPRHLDAAVYQAYHQLGQALDSALQVFGVPLCLIASMPTPAKIDLLEWQAMRLLAKQMLAEPVRNCRFAEKEFQRYSAPGEELEAVTWVFPALDLAGILLAAAVELKQGMGALVGQPELAWCYSSEAQTPETLAKRPTGAAVNDPD